MPPADKSGVFSLKNYKITSSLEMFKKYLVSYLESRFFYFKCSTCNCKNTYAKC